MIDFKKPQKINKKLFSKKNEENSKEEITPEVERAQDATWIKENYSEVIKEAEDKISEKNDNAASDATPRKKVDIKRYKDPEGLTIKKMEIGLWFIKNRSPLIKFIVTLVVFLNIILWPLFLYSFGKYLIFGISQDRRTIEGLTSSTLFDHNYIVSISPQPIDVKDIKIIDLPNNKFDIYALLENSSEKYWAHFDYSFFVNNEKISSSSSFILPGESKYLLALHKTSKNLSGDPAINIENLQWRRVDNHIIPDWKEFTAERMKFKFDDKNFISAQSSVLTEKINLNELKFKVTNDSNYNYWSVRLLILIKGRGGIVGVNQYIMDKIMSGDTQNISVVWPGKFSRIQDIEIIPEIDLSRDDIYMDFTSS